MASAFPVQQSSKSLAEKRMEESSELSSREPERDELGRRFLLAYYSERLNLLAVMNLSQS